MLEEPKQDTSLFSIVIPLYQGRRYIDECLRSIFNSFKDYKFEIIIIDNYSTDGSYEIALSYARKYPEVVRVLRFRSTRGRARQIGLMIARGRFIVPMDIDVELIPNRVRKLIKWYLNKPFRDCVGLATVKGGGAIGIFPKHILLSVGGWRDLNYDENVDLLARLYKCGLLITAPIRICRDLFPITDRKLRELRYARGFRYYLRKFRNRIDLTCGNADTLCKVVVVVRYHYGEGILRCILASFRHIVCRIINFLRGCKPFQASRYLQNRFYVTAKRIMTAVSPRDIGLDDSEVEFYNESDADVRFVSKYYPKVLVKLRHLR